MRIGLLYPARNPVESTNWSGTPAGLAGGLAANGIEVVPIGARVPLGVHEVVAALSRVTGRTGAVADRMPVRQLARTRALTRGLDGAGALDAVLAMGTEMYDLSSVIGNKVPCITYDDGTLRQMINHPDSDISQAGFPRNHVEKWIARQKKSTAAADLCCASTSWAANSLETDYQVKRERIAVVGMGHRPRGAGPDARDWSIPRFLFVGVDWQRKNGAAVVEAFGRVRESHPQATLHLVGEHPVIGQPGVIGYGLVKRNDVQGQEMIDALYSTATAFVLPSRFDPSPISYLEAASAGLPVIATAVGGAGELLGGGSITVDPLNTEDIEAAMMRLCDPQEAQRLGAAASAAAAASSWTDVAARILDSFTACTERSHGKRSAHGELLWRPAGVGAPQGKGADS